MKKLLLFGSALMAGISFAQTTIYQENFETGNSFTLNTADLGGASTFNTWLVNNAYTGGSGTFVCLGFPFSFTVPNTPAQPGGITGSPSSNYLHISAQAAISNGINCASYIPADGTCVSPESNFAKMTSPISTSGFTNVTIDFWWMCAGSAQGFGELYYSLNGGSTWTLKQSNFNNVTNWNQTAIADPLWDNQASLMFAFRFVNNTASTAADPSFSIDEIVVTGSTAVASAIATTGVQPLSSWCVGDEATLQVSFDATGTFNPGNIFTAELSDALGSFAAPTAVGSLASSASGTQVVTAVVPNSTPVGTGYRIRVVASDPSTTGTDNGSDLVINPLPTVSFNTVPTLCDYNPDYTLVAMPAGGTFSGTAVTGSTFSPSTAGIGTYAVTYSFTDGNGCANSANQSITVDGCVGISEEAISYSIFPNPANGYFSILSDLEFESIALKDLNGRIIKEIVSNEEVNVSNLSAGVYIVELVHDGKRYTEQIVLK